MEDGILVDLAKGGSKEAFAALVKKYQAKVFNMAFSMTRDRATADDLAQEVFIKVYASLAGFAKRSEFSTWLYHISLNHIRDFLRKKGKKKEISLDDLGKGFPAGDDDTRVEEKERALERRKELVYRCLHSLPSKHRIILALRDIQGLSYRDISKILGISPGTVDSRVHRARKKLREKLSPYLSREGVDHELQEG